MKVYRKDIETNLPKKGFRKDAKGHHIYFHYWHRDKLTSIRTKISHTRKHKVIDNQILTQMRRQVKLDSNSDFVALVDCNMSHKQYEEILKNKELI